MNEIVQYEKQVVLETFDGNLYFTPASNYTSLKKAMNTDKFLELNGELLNVSTIKRVYQSDGEVGLNREEKQILEQKKKAFYEKLGRAPSKIEIANIIKRMKNEN